MAKRKRKSTVDSTTLDRFGRVVIPREVREKLGLHPGDSLALAIQGGALLLRREPPPREGVVYKGGIPVFTGRIPPEDMDVVALIHRHREERMRRHAGLDRK
ncbi:MAG: AbrB/MazE/SpoVT family DNA-binding domain-containing protein [Planctomycetaceae bacterium]|nr:AbrB/MazE/SpoVT family DNA-binding domain-containing protein [Planctomycetota bacterium]NUN52328.1 AbrB/MazE/SpoVT family DNA-binding domain-containing protein [Planctomycetaceae bacterium]